MSSVSANTMLKVSVAVLPESSNASHCYRTITDAEVSITALAAQAGINNGEIAEFGTLILAAGAHNRFQ